jgi:hypothetical protein
VTRPYGGHDFGSIEHVKSNATSTAQGTSAAASAKRPLKADEPMVERVTKQERVLTLLSQPEGASNELSLLHAHAGSMSRPSLARRHKVDPTGSPRRSPCVEIATLALVDAGADQTCGATHEK